VDRAFAMTLLDYLTLPVAVHAKGQAVSSAAEIGQSLSLHAPMPLDQHQEIHLQRNPVRLRQQRRNQRHQLRSPHQRHTSHPKR